MTSSRSMAAISSTVLLALAGACGGRQMLDLPATDVGAGAGAGASGSAGAVGTAGTIGTAGASGSAGSPFTVGALDLATAPPMFSMTCDSGIGVITFVNPCLIGGKIGGDLTDASSPGPHEIECTIANAAETVAWSFMMIFPPFQNPQSVLPLTPTAVGADLNGQRARISMVTGALTLDIVDPTQRAFEGRFTGAVTWIEASGAMVQCKIDTPVWGAPGPFS